MPVNKNAAFRYRVIDELLTGGKAMKFEDFIDKVGDKMYEEFGREDTISERSIVSDIALMRSQPPKGFAAPIVRRRKMIYYSSPDYSINKMPLIAEDLLNIESALHLLSQYKGLPHSGMLVAVLEKIKHSIPVDRVTASRSNTIQVEQNQYLRGLEWLSPLFALVEEQLVADIEYQSFSQNTPQLFVFHPYLLKEFNNRWFVLGLNQIEGKLWLLALDRIKKIEGQNQHFNVIKGFDHNTYFDDVVGVTVMESVKVEKVILKFQKNRAPYILTKPIHVSQKIISHDESGELTISLNLKRNNELIALVLSFGKDVEVMAPSSLRLQIGEILSESAYKYQCGSGVEFK